MRAESIAQSNTFIVLGQAMVNLKQALRFVIQGKVDLEQLKKQIVFIGYESMPMIIALCSLSCMILAINTAQELNHHGGRDLIGSLIAISDLREILPIFIAFAIGARSGTAITAEIATMKVTEQVDALRMMRTGPIYFLLTPKLVAGVLLSPFIVAIAAFASIYSGMMVCNISVGLENAQFLESAWQAITMKEYFYPLIKTAVFTVYSILINVTIGLGCEGGAREVGFATTRATAWVMVGIIILDGILTPILYL